MSKLGTAFNTFRNKASMAGAGAMNYMRTPGNFGYSLTGNSTLGPGITAFGQNFGHMANVGSAINQGVQAAQGLSGLSRSKEDVADLKNKIILSAMNNPLVNDYLTADQRQLLGQLRRGTYSESLGDDALRGAGANLGNAATGALTGLMFGGIPGAAIGGIGGLINGGISGATQGSQQEAEKLQALYDTLAEAEMSYNSMKRPVFTGLGIQHRYQNMYS